MDSQRRYNPSWWAGRQECEALVTLQRDKSGAQLTFFFLLSMEPQPWMVLLTFGVNLKTHSGDPKFRHSQTCSEACVSGDKVLDPLTVLTLTATSFPCAGFLQP